MGSNVSANFFVQLFRPTSPRTFSANFFCRRFLAMNPVLSTQIIPHRRDVDFIYTNFRGRPHGECECRYIKNSALPGWCGVHLDRNRGTILRKLAIANSKVAIEGLILIENERHFENFPRCARLVLGKSLLKIMGAIFWNWFLNKRDLKRRNNCAPLGGDVTQMSIFRPEKLACSGPNFWTGARRDFRIRKN